MVIYFKNSKNLFCFAIRVVSSAELSKNSTLPGACEDDKRSSFASTLFSCFDTPTEPSKNFTSPKTARISSYISG